MKMRFGTKIVRQPILFVFILCVLVSVTTLNTLAASWHVSNTHFWIIQNACSTHIEVVSAWNDANAFPPPATYEWEAHSWMDDGPAGPVVGDEPTWVPAGDQLFGYLGVIDLTIEHQPTPIVFEAFPGERRKTHNWGSEIISWDTPIEVGQGIFVRHPTSSEGFVVAVQDCGS